MSDGMSAGTGYDSTKPEHQFAASHVSYHFLTMTKPIPYWKNCSNCWSQFLCRQQWVEEFVWPGMGFHNERAIGRGYSTGPVWLLLKSHVCKVYYQFSVSVMKCHDHGQLQGEKFISFWFTVSEYQRLMIPEWRHGSRNRKLRSHILDHEQESESTESKSFKPQNFPVTHVLQQGCTSQISLISTSNRDQVLKCLRLWGTLIIQITKIGVPFTEAGIQGWKQN